MRVSSIELAGKTPYSMYVTMSKFQDGHILSLIAIITAPEFPMLGILSVSWMNEWFTPNDLVLALLDMMIILLDM